MTQQAQGLHATTVDAAVQHLSVLQTARDRVQDDLMHVLAGAHLPEPLQGAVRHAVLLGGKRVRPALVYAACLACGSPVNAAARRAAVAVELIHCYSLVHDDLPCMDDDALRRGQPTCHIQYGEATALLAGDMLQSLAFEVLSSDLFAPVQRRSDAELVQSARQLAVLAQRAGRMVVGQVLDLQAEDRQVSEAELEQVHINKTGALIDAAVQLGALSAGALPNDPRLTALSQFSHNLGLAFQVQDDVLDVTATTETLGKPAGSDEKLHKSTYPRLLGLAGAQARAAALHQSALQALQPLGELAAPLQQIAAFLLTRQS